MKERHQLRKLGMLIFLMLATLPLSGKAYFWENGIYYTILSEEDKMVEVSGIRVKDTSKEVVIPEKTNEGYSVISIGEEAFYYCTLTSVTLPKSLTKIGYRGFYGCFNLTAVTFPESLTEIGQEAFEMCSLTSLTLPDSVLKIGSGAFRSCELIAVTLPESLTEIGEYAFENCINLNKLVIHSRDLEIKNKAFRNCTEIIKIECFTTNPPECRYRALHDINKELCRLYVPVGCEDKYRDAYQWMEFQNVYGTLESSGILEVKETKDNHDIIAVYNVNGCLTKLNTPGLVIVKYSDGSVKKFYNQ